MNFTLSVPSGTVNHGNPHLICTPPSWFDFLVFYITNYFAHAATIVTFPGQGRSETAVAVVLALLMPGAGVSRASAALVRHARFYHKDALEQALQAGALCMVVKKKEKKRKQAKEDTELEDLLSSTADRNHLPVTAVNGRSRAKRPRNDARSPNIHTRQKLLWWEKDRSTSRIPRGTDIHGEYRLPPNYYLRFVPLKASIKFGSNMADKNDPTTTKLVHGTPKLASTYGFSKLVVSLIQAIWASTTLYRARGDQIQKYGYAAFGLTVAPYAWMSVVNILANLFTPNYPALFMIRTPVMDEAEKEGGFFRCELNVDIGEERKSTFKSDSTVNSCSLALGCFLALVPLVLVGSLSGFAIAHSTSIQRGFTMSWLVIGIFYGIGIGVLEMRGFKEVEDGDDEELSVAFGMMLVFGAPPIGGMVMVGLMMRAFGVCTRF